MKGFVNGADFQFYSDPQRGLRAKWEALPENILPDQRIETACSYTVPVKGTYALQYKLRSDLQLEITQPAARTLPWRRGFLREVLVELEAGANRIHARITNSTGEVRPLAFSSRLLDTSGQPVTEDLLLPLPETEEIPFDGKNPDLTGFTPATGTAFQSCGRFGFSKGDGVLDYSMPAFGIISRPFIAGHPRYRKELLWNFSLLPAGETESGCLSKVYHLPENETVECDWAHCRWTRQLSAGGYLSFDYSLLAPALLVETDLRELTLSQLGTIGNYAAVTLPLSDGALTRNHRDGIFYDQETDGKLAQNWILLSRSGTFPEVPILLTFRTPPQKILRTEDSITLSFAGPIAWLMLSFPFGMQLFDPEELTDDWYAAALPLCAAAHRRNLARPVSCQEYFRIDGQQVQILDQYTYRYFDDSLHTAASTAAPLPPPVLLAQQGVADIQIDRRAVSLELPTKYGPLYAVPGSCFSTYTLPIPAYRCEFPFHCPDRQALGDALHSDFDDYLHYHLDAEEIANPGNYSFIFQYALPAKLFPVLQPEDLQKLKDAMITGLDAVCNPDFCYNGPDGRQCLSWYQRTDPYTGVSYYSTYLHVVGVRQFANCHRELIENSDLTFIEVDWGNAMSLYGTYLAAMFTDSWDRIRENWHVFRKAFDYYLVTMDWACMSAAYAENGITWNDGTNYGGYLGFLNMADMLGMEEDRAMAMYAYAKMTAMRLGLFQASQTYFHRFFGVQPWYTSKFFHEETDAAYAYQSYPDDIVTCDYRVQSLYNMTTEGHYTEAMQMYASYLPGETEKLLRAAEAAVAEAGNTLTGPTDLNIIYHTRETGHLGHQETFTYLMLSIMLRRFTPEALAQMIRDAAQNNRIAKEMLGHPVLSRRRVPENWTYAMLMCYLRSGDTPRITAWQNLDIVRADYPVVEIAARSNPWLEVTCENKPNCRFCGAPLECMPAGKHLWRIRLSGSGTLEFL